MDKLIKKGLISVVVFLISLGLILAFTVYCIKTQEAKEIAFYREDVTLRIRQNLKNHVAIAYAAIDSNYRRAMNRIDLEKKYGLTLRSMINAAEGILTVKSEQAVRKQLTLEEAQTQAMKEIGAIRYRDGVGYIWINDTGKPFPRMLMTPLQTSLIGQVLDDPSFNCALGKGENLFAAARDICLASGEGFVDYVWPKPSPNGTIPDVPKLSYVKLFREWNWILGTGVYIDDVLIDAQEESKSDLRDIRFDNGTGYFWINDISEPFPKMVMHAVQPELEGTVLDNPKYNCVGDTKENLFKQAVQVGLKSREGFIEYRWPKPTAKGLVEDVPKLSYVRLFKPWGWVIGSGIYIDDVDKALAKKTEELRPLINNLLIKVSGLIVGIAIVAVLVMVRLEKKIDKASGMMMPPSLAPEIKEKTTRSISEPGPTQAGESSPPGDDKTKEIAAAAKEICKAVAEEQTKIIAYVLAMDSVRGQEHPQAVLEIAEEVRRLARRTEEGMAEIKKALDSLQHKT